MRKSFAFAAVLSLVMAAPFVLAKEEAAAVKVGDAAPAFSLVDLGGKGGESITLDGYKGKIVVLSFDSIKCPVVAAYRDRWSKLVEKYAADGKVVFVAANPNANESNDDVRTAMATVKGTVAAKDVDNKAADAYGATKTPHIYVIDAAGKIRYVGAIDDDYEGKKVTKNYLSDALDELLAGKEVTTSSTPAVGCGIKRAKK